MSFQLVSTIFIAVALAMDAFSVSITKGFTQKDLNRSQIFYYGLFFGFFQFLMPLLGYLCGSTVASLVSAVASVLSVFLELQLITLINIKAAIITFLIICSKLILNNYLSI